MARLIIALTLGLVYGLAAAQQPVGCDAVAPVGSRIVSRDTQAASESAERLVRSAGAGADLRLIRADVLKTHFPNADVETTLRRMLQAYCEVVRADPALSDEQKSARIDLAGKAMLKPVEGLAEVARTNSRIRRSGWRGDDRMLVLASAEDDGFFRVAAEYTPLAPSDTADDEFLRPTPWYVNDSNKYFVVVGSAHSEKEAISLMNRLNAKAPKYDFVVYLPYGENASYGVMMATWVSKEVAMKALRIARETVAPDAYLWACRSTGETC